MEYLSVLRGCATLRGLSEASLAKLVALARPVTYRDGELIFQQGDRCPGMLVVAEGAVQVFQLSPAGKKHVLHFVQPGLSFAEVALVGGFPCPASAEASATPTTCVLLPRRGMEELLEHDHEFCRQLLVGMAMRVQHLVAQLEDLVLRDAVSRLARHLQRLDPGVGGVGFTLPVRKKDLASHLNMTSETLSRSLRRLSDLGLVALPDQQQVQILDQAGLRDLVEGLLPGELP
jgi:CRP/FNR family transcriptional regulator